MTGGLPPAPRWAWILMALGVVSIAVLSYVTVNRPPPPSFPAAEAAGTRAPSETTAPATAAPTTGPPPVSGVPRVLVVGDGFSATDPAPAEQGWPELLRGDLESAGRPVALTVAAADRAGYAEPDPGGATFSTLALDAGTDFDVVVFFGSRHDIAGADDVRDAAEAAFTLARAASPDARLVVIGPAWAGTPPGYIVTNRDALAAAAGPADAVFVDPLAASWFSGPAAALPAPDGVRVTAEGHRYLADLIRPVVEGALA